MSETPTLDGPRYGPTTDGPPKQLIILLHGVGSDGKDLIELAPFLAQSFPNAAFVAPNAPNRYDQGLSGYQWLSSGIRIEAEVVEAVKTSAEILNAFIDEELRNVGLGPESLALIGFSQGTMMSLFTAPRRDQPRPRRGDHRAARGGGRRERHGPGGVHRTALRRGLRRARGGGDPAAGSVV